MQINTNPRRRNIEPVKGQSHHVPIRFILFLILTVVILSGGLIAYHQYKITYTSMPVPEIKAGISGGCMDVYHNKATSGTVVQVANCDGRPSQDWSIKHNTVIHNKSCLTAPGNPVENDAKIVMEPCDGQVNQTWLTSYLDSFENPSSGQCLDIPHGEIGGQLIAGPCNDLTGSNETWLASIWSKTNTAAATVNCDFSAEGEQIGCDAAKQWVKWNSSGVDHESLLNTYSDGNRYEEWCADFVSYVYREAGYPLTGGERDNWDEYVAGDVQYDANFTYNQAGSSTPQPGDVAYFNYPGGHVEIVLLGGTKPIFVYGDSGTTDKSTGNGEMEENDITQDNSLGQVVYYLSPSR
jgi:hypothetical protein